jgi:hypothetical protein
MRKTIAALQVSLDGFIEGPNGELDAKSARSSSNLVRTCMQLAVPRWFPA